MPILSFEQAMQSIGNASNKYLLLGNGFSIALKPDIFSYTSLFEQTDFGEAKHLPALFEALGTHDFEIVIRHLLSAAKIVKIYCPELERLVADLIADADAVKAALVNVVAQRHPDLPHNVRPEQYQACRVFLLPFDHIFTLNYDVLLYWTLMQTELDELDLMPDDGFRHPDGDPTLPYVSWQQSQKATIHYLHGALHLFDRDTEITKYTWSKTDLPIVQQIRDALSDNNYPLFVAEGESASKMQRIMHNAYLHKAMRSLEGCCRPANGTIVVFGHSLAENDEHIFRCIVNGKIGNLLIGIFGDPTSPQNLKIKMRAETLIELRKDKYKGRRPLKITYYDAATANVWG